MINKTNTHHYKWGDNCDSWVFLASEGLSVKLESMPPNTREKLHKHSQAQQFFFIIAGKASFYLNGEIKQLNSQEGIAVSANTKHYIYNESENPLQFLVISQPNTKQDRIDYT